MYFEEAGKRWWQTYEGSVITRVHDENYKGKQFQHKRCPFCNRITCIATLHWLNHLDKCAPKEYSNSDLLEMRWKKLEDIHTNFLGRD